MQRLLKSRTLGAADDASDLKEEFLGDRPDETD